jgi:hypothetical protein
MNTTIEIHNENTNETGTYKVWYKDIAGNKCMRVISESLVTSMLEMNQKEKFFMGQFRFRIKSEYDFRTIVLNGECPAGF